MPKTVDIDLKEPFTGHNGLVKKVTVREPRGRDFVELGEPAVLSRTANGTFVEVQNDAAIAAYVTRCVTEPDVLLVMSSIGLTDMMAVKAAVLDFFRDAREAPSDAESKSL